MFLDIANNSLTGTRLNPSCISRYTGVTCSLLPPSTHKYNVQREAKAGPGHEMFWRKIETSLWKSRNAVVGLNVPFLFQWTKGLEQGVEEEARRRRRTKIWIMSHKRNSRHFCFCCWLVVFNRTMVVVVIGPLLLLLLIWWGSTSGLISIAIPLCMFFLCLFPPPCTNIPRPYTDLMKRYHLMCRNPR